MKPPAFSYVASASVEQTVGLLAQHDGEARVVAGGQSLIPLMNFRLAHPSVLVDINPIASLAYVRDDGTHLAIGAMTREAMIETSDVVARHCPILAEASTWIGHPAIRHRGTIGGSLAHNDPNAEYPLVAALLDAELVIAGSAGTRTASFRDFSLGHYVTGLEPDEIVIEVRLPVLASTTGTSFLEIARRSGDFALVSVAATLDVDGGAVSGARLALGGVAGTPLRITDVEELLVGRPWDSERVAAVADRVAELVEPPSDFHGSAEYRTHLARTLVARCLEEAHRRVGN